MASLLKGWFILLALRAMSEAKDVVDLKNSPEGEAISHDSGDDPKESDKDQNDESPMPSPQQEEEAVMKKYGGMLPKKPPLISKDHERAYFDSADWTLGKTSAVQVG
ncbi:uncharacterized protein LOC130748366 isoform X1 [Lotus japonicus]|uniref:uncharacterized protein LOC130748366 isoform X1 n=2 Tax=Lotus japonicus TaxID=34305 RepID=UPI0025845DE9|nr:uncharacterized protein LOC130748366 isoform X1 [Lotus japonicus]XP_057457571.1 uncharacterized protein LOC130748366 isoform X1 [Lotus japonicus]